MTPHDKLAAAFAYARQKSPYFDVVLTGLVRHEMPGLGTFAVTDDAVLLWDPAAVEKWWIDKPNSSQVASQRVAAVLVHEGAGHVLRRHAARCKACGCEDDRALWNAAADAEINDDLVDGGWDLPGDYVHPEKFGCAKGLAAEEYLEALRKQREKRRQGQGQSQKSADAGKDLGDGPASPAAGEGWCGSGAGRPVPNEPEKQGGTAGSEDGGSKPIGRTPAEVESMRRAVAEAVIAHEASKGRGSVPGGWVTWATDVLKPPKIRWQDKLGRAVRANIGYRPGGIQHSYRRLDRRQSGIGFGAGNPVLPSTIMPVPHIAFVIDTSGSMGKASYEAAMPECDGLLRACGADVDFMACDARVHAHKRIRHWREFLPLMKGGGGTDFRPVFDALVKERRRPDLVIFATDGQGPAPKNAPTWCKVIWLLVGPYKTAPCTWGEQIEID